MNFVLNMWKHMLWQVVKLHELEGAVAAAGFLCRVDGCDKSYVHHSSRVK